MTREVRRGCPVGEGTQMSGSVIRRAAVPPVRRGWIRRVTFVAVVALLVEPAFAQSPLPPAQPKAKAAAGKELAQEFQLVSISGSWYHMGDSALDGAPLERPAHVVIVKPFRLGKTEVTVGQFRMFVTATEYFTDAERNVGANGCRVLDVASGHFDWRAGASWSAPGFKQAGVHPVVCVSWQDAQAFIAWLNRESGRRFRLPSEAEWEYAARAGASGAYPWGSQADEGCQYANGADQTPGPGDRRPWSAKMKCKDGYFLMAPVGSYEANRDGLQDMIGNVWEWTADCWHDNFVDAPTDGSAWSTGDCTRRVIRSSTWYDLPAELRVSYRAEGDTADRNDLLGFRLAEDP